MAALLSSSDIYWTLASGPEVEAGIGPHRVGRSPGRESYPAGLFTLAQLGAVFQADGKQRRRAWKKRIGASECCLLSGVPERGSVVESPWVACGDKKLADI